MKSIDAIIKELTLDEKIAMIHGAELFKTGAVKRLGIPALISSDGPAGIRQDFAPDKWTPVGKGKDKVSWLPSNTCLAESWDKNLAKDFGTILGEETRGRGKDVILAPGINIKRTPLCGRNFEYMSEDPYLTASIAVPLIRGVQENDVATCVKHFALNNQEFERMSVEALVDERTLFELYLPAFEACTRAIEGEDSLSAHSLSIMAAYNRFAGDYACENSYLLQEILRKKWGYDGVVISDWGGVHNTEKAANHGLDIEMSVTPDFDDYFMATPLKKAIENGEIEESVVDEKVRHILLLMSRLHMFDDERKSGCYNTPKHQQKIQEIAESGIVLLKNDKNHLPLDKTVKTIAVIGDNAIRSHANGGGSAEINTLYDISPFLGLHMHLGGNTKIEFAPGYYIDNEKNVVGEVDWQAASLAVDYSAPDKRAEFEKEIQPKRRDYLDEAVALAKECDEVIFIGGLNHAYDVEGFDRPDMKLPYGQDELIEALLDVNPNTTIVLINGSPVEMPWLKKAHSLIHTSYCGMNGGLALARVLFGDVNPSGHLCESYPIVLEDSPAHLLGEYPGKDNNGSHRIVNYNENLMVGYRYYQTENKPVAFPFGYGLSYTDFAYDNLQISSDETSDENIKVTASFTLTNTGSREGKEVVQVYISPKNSPVNRPAYELKAFQKVELAPGETKEIIIKLDQHDFCYYDVNSGFYTATSGEYEICIGNSVADIHLRNTISLAKDYKNIPHLYR